MAMIACTGCGLPRADDQVGVVPCPVCAFAPISGSPTGGSRPVLANAPDPTAGLPADVSEMSNRAQTRASSRRVGWTIAFLLGLAVGVGGLLAWQAILPAEEPAKLTLAAPSGAAPPVAPAPPFSAVVAPMPHAPRPREPVAETPPVPKSIPRPEPKPPVGNAVVHNLGQQPDSVHTIPPLKNGEHIILRGSVRMLRVNGLEAGCIVDASGLEAGSIYVSGKIDGGAILKLAAPNSVVQLSAAVSGKSRIEIHAPGGDVRFTQPTTSAGPGSRIDGGSMVAITARTVDLRGDVDGAGTSVAVVLTRNGSLKAAAVRGTAAIEYRTEDPKAPDPPATADLVAPTAAFRKVN